MSRQYSRASGGARASWARSPQSQAAMLAAEAEIEANNRENDFLMAELGRAATRAQSEARVAEFLAEEATRHFLEFQAEEAARRLTASSVVSTPFLIPNAGNARQRVEAMRSMFPSRTASYGNVDQIFATGVRSRFPFLNRSPSRAASGGARAGAGGPRSRSPRSPSTSRGYAPNPSGSRGSRRSPQNPSASRGSRGYAPNPSGSRGSRRSPQNPSASR